MWIWFRVSCILFLGEYCIWELAKFYIQNAYVAHSLLSVFTLCVCVSILCFKLCVCERAYAHDCGVSRDQKALDPLEQVLHQQLWTPWPVCRGLNFSVKAIHTLQCWAISPASIFILVIWCQSVCFLSISFSILTLYPNIWGVFPAPPMCYTENRLTRRLIGFM